jgi:pimeloyl-ACP methyl ester carboxylesterase
MTDQMTDTSTITRARLLADPLTDTVEPYRLHVPEEQLQDLRERLDRTRWPDRETVLDASQGALLEKVQSLCAYWRDAYDWRRCEALINEWGSSRTVLDGLGIHFLHVRSPEPDALPLLMAHGWPGSVLEFAALVGPLTNPAAHGGAPRDAFHLVIPSMPGFGFSDKPTETGWGVARTADAWIALMERLGYHTWAAQGGDWGSAVTEAISRKAPAGLVGTHVNLPLVFPSPEEAAAATVQEQAMLASAGRYQSEQSAYAQLQATRPQTVGYSLADSPTGLAAWIYTLFQDVTDSGGDPESVLTLDQMLDDIMMYWLPNTGASSARLYWEAAREQAAQAPPSGPNATPAGFSIFPGEAVRASRRWIDSRYSNVLHYGELDRGGHFAAMEQPAALAEEIRITFRAVR